MFKRVSTDHTKKLSKRRRLLHQQSSSTFFCPISQNHLHKDLGVTLSCGHSLSQKGLNQLRYHHQHTQTISCPCCRQPTINPFYKKSLFPKGTPWHTFMTTTITQNVNAHKSNIETFIRTPETIQAFAVKLKDPLQGKDQTIQIQIVNQFITNYLDHYCKQLTKQLQQTLSSKLSEQENLSENQKIEMINTICQQVAAKLKGQLAPNISSLRKHIYKLLSSSL